MTIRIEFIYISYRSTTPRTRTHHTPKCALLISRFCLLLSSLWAPYYRIGKYTSAHIKIFFLVLLMSSQSSILLLFIDSVSLAFCSIDTIYFVSVNVAVCRFLCFFPFCSLHSFTHNSDIIIIQSVSLSVTSLNFNDSAFFCLFKFKCNASLIFKFNVQCVVMC